MDEKQFSIHCKWMETQNKNLASIRSWVAFLGIMVIIGIGFTACNAVMSFGG